ncbi:MAG: ATP-binding protein [Gaiellaceae bacterium]
MRSIVEGLRYLNLAVFTAVAVVAIRQWRLRRTRAGIWAALTFGSLALVADLGPVLPEEPGTIPEHVLLRTVIAVLVLFPYFLYRFTTAFQPPSLALERRLGLMTVAVIIWTFALPHVPGDGEPRPAWFLAYLAAFLLHWTVLSVVVGVRLWRAGVGQPAVARRRMRMLTFAAVLLTLSLLIGVGGASDDSPVSLVAGLLVTLSALGFLLGLAPPTLLRLIWRRPEQDRMREVTVGLVRATSEAEVVREVLPSLARMVGGRAAALLATDGRLIGSHGLSEEEVAQLGSRAEVTADAHVQEVEVPGVGRLLVWTSPYSPYFGEEELGLMSSLGALMGLALDRVHLFAQERAARLELERADEVKSNFISLAAHELRTPVTTVYGLAETIRHRGPQLDAETVEHLQTTLAQQTRRMADLVEQLLDLSRLDAKAIEIRPERLRLAARVAEVVALAAGDESGSVEVDVSPGLEADVDPQVLDRIVSNLVVNALRHGRAPVRITAAQENGTLRLCVEDRGPGVPGEFVPHLFDRFMRSETAQSSGRGSGLGLAIARSYALAHDGELSYVPGIPTGARFELTVPAGSAT